MQATNSTGQIMHFNQNRVVLVTGRLPTDTTDVFYLHGIAPPPFPQLAGNIDDFIKTMVNGDHFAKLTFAHSGETFYLNTQMVQSINPLTANLQAQHPNANAVITVSGRNRFVRETVDQARGAVNSAGGNL